MSYNITASDNTVNITIADGTVDTSTTLNLPGPNFLGYGQLLDENLIHLLTNFASNSAPAGTNLQGQLWFNKSTQTLNVYTNQGYTPVSGVTISNTTPSNPAPGEIWFNSTTEQTYIYYNGAFVLIGPIFTSAQGTCGAIPVQLYDISGIGVTHNVLQMQYGGTIIAMFSSDPAFQPSPAINGFPWVYSGLTINTSIFSNTGQFYANANTAAYLPKDPTIQNIQNNINLLSGNISSVSAAATASVNAANVALTNYINSISSSITSQLAAAEVTLTNQSNQIVANATANLNATIANVEAFANTIVANLSGIQANLTALSSVTVNSILGIQSNIATLQSEVYTNASVAAYLPYYGGAISASTITATTPSYNDSSTNVATTDFVRSIIPRGIITLFSGGGAPAGWALCNGQNGTPDLRDKFVLGAGGSLPSSGGASSSAVTGIPAHTHTVTLTGTTDSGGAHTPTGSFNDPGHSHGYVDPQLPSGGSTSYQNGPQGSTWRAENIANAQTQTSVTGIAITVDPVPAHQHTLTVSGTTASTGTGATVATIPPYYALAYIMKL